MPKAKPAKRNGSASSSPYAVTPKSNIFKMNTDLGQHILKNPGVAQAIVDKADLKQSDVCICSLPYFCVFVLRLLCLILTDHRCSDRSRSWSWNGEFDR